jgi:hypothetical protein
VTATVKLFLIQAFSPNFSGLEARIANDQTLTFKRSFKNRFDELLKCQYMNIKLWISRERQLPELLMLKARLLPAKSCARPEPFPSPLMKFLILPQKKSPVPF